MAKQKIFPSEMKNMYENCTPESIAMNLAYFQDQLHLIHWQTTSYAEHKATGELYEYVFEFKDGVLEKIMGYTGMRPKAFKYKPLIDNCDCMQVVKDLKAYSDKMGMWAENKGFTDIRGMADELSGMAAKTLYLLTLN